MAKPAAEAKAAHAARGFTEVVGRGKGHLRSRKPGTDQYAVTTQVGGVGWHFGAGPYTEAHEVDTAWVADTGAWQWKMELADYHVHARNVFNAGNIIEYRDPVSQQWVIFDPQSINWVNQDTSRQQIAIKQAVNASVSGDVMTFTNAWGSGRHFRYTAQTVRLQKVITIDSAANLPTPTVSGPSIWLETEFSISHSSGVEVYIDGVLWTKQNGVRVQTGNRVEFRNSAGNQVFWYLDFPRAWDSAGNETIGQMEFRRDGGPSNLFVTVRIPRTWVDAATFPIFLDPTIDATVAGDNFNARDREDNGEWSTTFLYTGSSVNAFARHHTGHIFTLSGIASGNTVDVAYMTLRVNMGSGRGNDPNVDIHCENVDSAANFSTNADVFSRTRTSESVAWVVTDVASNGVDVNTPSLVSPVQAVINRGGWAAGNDLNVVMISRSDFTAGLGFNSYTDSATTCSRLHVEYTAGSATTNQDGHRYYNDDGNQSTATTAADEDAGLTVAPDVIKHIRIQIDAASGDPASMQYRLEFRENTGSWGAWEAVQT